MSFISQTDQSSADLPMAGKKILAVAESALAIMSILVPESKRADFYVPLMFRIADMRSKERTHEQMPDLIRAAQIVKYARDLSALGVSDPIIHSFCLDYFQQPFPTGELPLSKRDLINKSFFLGEVHGLLSKMVDPIHIDLVDEFMEVFSNVLLEYSCSVNLFLLDHKVGKAFAIREYLVTEHQLFDLPLHEVPEEILAHAKDTASKMNKVSTGDLRIKSSTDALKTVIRKAIVAAFPSQRNGMKVNAEEHLLHPEFVERMKSGTMPDNAVINAIGSFIQTVSYLNQTTIEVLSRAEAGKEIVRSASISWASPAKAIENTRVQMLKALKSYLLQSMTGRYFKVINISPALYPCLNDNFGMDNQDSLLTLTMAFSKTDDKTPKYCRYQFDVPLSLLKISYFLIREEKFSLTDETFLITLFEFQKEATQLNDERMLRLHRVFTSELEGLNKTLKTLKSFLKIDLQLEASSLDAPSTTLASSRSVSFSLSADPDVDVDDDACSVDSAQDLVGVPKYLQHRVNRHSRSLMTDAVVLPDLSPTTSPKAGTASGHVRYLSVPEVTLQSEERPKSSDISRKLAICRRLAGPIAATYAPAAAAAAYLPPPPHAAAVSAACAVAETDTAVETKAPQPKAAAQSKNPSVLFQQKGAKTQDNLMSELRSVLALKSKKPAPGEVGAAAAAAAANPVIQTPKVKAGQ